MADVKISALPAATTPLAGTELVPIVQSGVTSRVSVDNLTAGKTVAASTVNVDANTASAAVRITQTGTGNALMVEDSANPDATPFVVDANGSLIVGGTARFATATTGSPLIQAITGSVTISRFLNDAGQQRLEFIKSRSTTAGSAATAVQNGDPLGQVNWQGADGTAFVIAAQINAEVDGTPGTNDMPGRLVFSTTLDGASSPTERMRITNAGNVGIGTSAPVTRFHVSAADSTISMLFAGSARGIRLGFSPTISNIEGVDQTGTGSYQPLGVGGSQVIFTISAIERMRIDTSGNVGIGTASPQNRLQVNGSFGRGAPVTKTGNFTLADTENWIICNGAGSITVTFPAASSWTGREVMIKTIAAQTVVSASSNVVPLAGGAAGTAILPASAGSWATLVSDGTNWIIMQS